MRLCTLGLMLLKPPPPESQSQWDTDGIPKWIELGLLDWKTHTPVHRSKRYGIRLYRNRIDMCFCPVMWLLMYLPMRSCALGLMLLKPRVRESAEQFVSI